jgi:hypothetical protein
LRGRVWHGFGQRASLGATFDKLHSAHFGIRLVTHPPDRGRDDGLVDLFFKYTLGGSGQFKAFRFRFSRERSREMIGVAGRSRRRLSRRS